MEKYEVSKEWIRKNSKKIKEAYLIGTNPKHTYDLSSAHDVLEILQTVDPVNATHDNAEIFSKVLRLFSLQMREKFKPKSQRRERIKN